MRKHVLVLATLIAAMGVVGVSAGTAEAAKRKAARVVVTPAPFWNYWWLSGQRDPVVGAAATVTAGAATGAYFATRHHSGVIGGAGGAYVATSMGCAVVSPMLATVWAKRELSRREVWTMTANCFLPFVGGWMVNAALDANPNPLWDSIGK